MRRIEVGGLKFPAFSLYEEDVYKSNVREKNKKCDRDLLLSIARVFILLDQSLISKIFSWLDVSVSRIAGGW